jgi:hypothetical protein
MANPSTLATGSDLGPIPGAGAHDAGRTDAGAPEIKAGEEPGTTHEKPTPDPGANLTGSAGPASEVKTVAASGVSEKTQPPAKGDAQAARGDSEATVPASPPDKSWPIIDCSKPHQEMEKATLESMQTKYGTTLVTDMMNAQDLLSYVTRNGLQEEKKVGEATLDTLIKTRERMRAGTFNAEPDEAKFREQYGIIAKAAEPVTVASLHDSLEKRWRKRWILFGEKREYPIAVITCLNYRIFATVILFALLFFQIYWTVSSAVLTKADALILELNKAPTKEVYLAQEAARQKAILAASPPDPSKPFPSPVASPPATPLPATPVQPVPPPATVAELKAQLTLDELVSKRAELESNYSMLKGLMKPTAWIFFNHLSPFFELPDKENDQPEKNPATKTESSVNISATPSSSVEKSTSSQQKEEPARNAKNLFVPSPFQTESATIRAVAVQVIEVMQKWVLPLLYGWLGSLVFVLRTLSLQVRERLFRKDSMVSHASRVYLGMISGLAIGWFWTSGPQGAGTAGPMSITTLSPLALAFMAGYGVELFFALLDKLVASFTNKA